MGPRGDIKGCESRLGASISPRFPTLDGRPRRPILPFWQLWTQFGFSPCLVAWRSLRAKDMRVFVGLPVDGKWNGGSDLQAGVEIYHSGYPRFWLILSSQNDPLLGTQFHPPGGPLAAPSLYAHEGTGPNIRLCTQIEVLGAASYPFGHWPCPGRASHAWELRQFW